MTSPIFSEKIAICIADHQGKILSQNQACIDLFPPKEGNLCHFISDLTADHLANMTSTEGMIFNKCYTVSQIPVDVVTINDGKTLTTMFYPLSEYIQKQLALFKEYHLSKRELEVAYHMLNRHSNDTIAKELFISKATLKTHINSIYKKIPKNKIYILKSR